MRTYEEAWEHAVDRRPFSNGTEGYAWMDNWCYRCKNDGDHLDDPGCPLVLVALMGRTPSEWFEQPWGQIRGRPEGETAPVLGDTYHCAEFRDEDDDGPREPKPIPDPPGQEILLPREPYEGVRMLMQPQRSMEAAR